MGFGFVLFISKKNRITHTVFFVFLSFFGAYLTLGFTSFLVGFYIDRLLYSFDEYLVAAKCTHMYSLYI